ncbi:MAG: hypothetical protein JWN53_1336, partial [Gemmatimonadetes bacterium]|nr:hypothetical protein [Gemmatimonadota bacterium]
MRARQWILVAVGLAAPFAVRAQHGAASAPSATRAPREASQYDFLLGEWEL